jgi:hypothetical protein
MDKRSKIEAATQFVEANPADWSQKDVASLVRDFLDDESLAFCKVRTIEQAVQHMQACWDDGRDLGEEK